MTAPGGTKGGGLVDGLALPFALALGAALADDEDALALGAASGVCFLL